jgi:hypothetical protein
MVRFTLFLQKIIQLDLLGSIGIVADTTWYEPASGSDADKAAAERALQFKVRKVIFRSKESTNFLFAC